MPITIKLGYPDVFFLTYDEPRKAENWARMRSKVDWAQNVDGVKGFDAAHKECARRAQTEWFITVDGDNDVDEEFFAKTVVIPDQYQNHVLSWAGTNVVNGLVYGNGGIKLWPRNVAETMNTHEHAEDERSRLDFCWTLDYLHMKQSYSRTYPNGSAEQAFRAGYREGVKLSLDQGARVTLDEFHTHTADINRQRLKVWCSVGADVDNGLWCMYGARKGVMDAFDDKVDLQVIADYDEFRWNVWLPLYTEFVHHNNVSEETGKKWLHDALSNVGHDVRAKVGLWIKDFDADTSGFFKSIYTPPIRSNLVFEIDE